MVFLDQWNRIESWEINSWIDLWQKNQVYAGGERIISSVIVLEKADWHIQRMKLNPLHYTQITSKWMKDLNVRPETIKPLEENVESKLLDIDHSNDFFFFFWIWPQKQRQQRENKHMAIAVDKFKVYSVSILIDLHILWND